MKCLIYILGLLLVCQTGFSQTASLEQDVDRIEVDSTIFGKSQQTKHEKAKIGVDLGMSYLMMSGGAGGPSMYVAPHVQYPLNQKLSLTGGVLFETGKMVCPVFSDDAFGYELLPMTRVFLYAGGTYKLNEKTTVNSTVYKQIVDVPRKKENNNSAQSDFNSQGMSMRIDYKLTKNITIGAQFSVESSHNPWFNGMYPPGMGYGFPNSW